MLELAIQVWYICCLKYRHCDANICTLKDECGEDVCVCVMLKFLWLCNIMASISNSDDCYPIPLSIWKPTKLTVIVFILLLEKRLWWFLSVMKKKKTLDKYQRWQVAQFLDYRTSSLKNWDQVRVLSLPCARHVSLSESTVLENLHPIALDASGNPTGKVIYLC